MTLDEADNILQRWGVYLEYVSRTNLILFGAEVPESTLPFPIKIILEASKVLAEHHHKDGNLEAVKNIEASVAYLISFTDDEKALINAAKRWSDPSWRKSNLPALKKGQMDWIKGQGDLNV